ncbi:MAG: Mur ligase family protein [Bacteroidales bacterium]
MKVHFIAVGGAVMHNLAIALKMKGYDVTGSDDEIYEQTRDRLRIVVGGSHGKTTTSAMIMHVLRHNTVPFDYLVGSAINGYETMVGLSNDSTIAVIEGDEYLTSPVDRRPKIHLYKPHIAIINGIAWDHLNVFPTFESYCEQFSVFASTIMPGGALLYYANDKEAVKIAEHCREDIRKVPYDIHGYMENKTGCYAVTINRMVKVGFFGAHNMQNLSAAREACLAAGLTEDQFYDAIRSFPGS